MAVSVICDPLPCLVLQCSGCRAIVGDTAPEQFVCVATLGGVRLVVVRAAAGVQVDRAGHQQALGAGAPPATYFNACCAGCGGVVGRVYTAPPAGAEALRGAFALEAGRCSSYKVGSAAVRVDGGGGGGGGGGAGAPRGGGGGAAARREPPGGGPAPAAPAGGADLPALVEALQAELVRMQGMILVHDAQLQRLPHYQALAGGEEGGA